MRAISRVAVSGLVLAAVTQVGAVELPLDVQWDDRTAGNWYGWHSVAIDPVYNVAIATENLSDECVVRKFNSVGNALWTTVLADPCWGIGSDFSGAWLVATGSQPNVSPLPPPNAAVHKLDSNGNAVWSATFSGYRFPSENQGYNRRARAPVVMDSSGNPVMPLYDDAGTLSEVVKLSAVDGSTVWSYATPGAVVLEMINHSGDDLYFFARDESSGNMFLTALDKDGNERWTQELAEDGFGLVGGPGVVCHSEATPLTGSSNYTSPRNICRSKTSGTVSWQHNPTFLPTDYWWDFNFKAFGADGSLHVAWTVSDYDSNNVVRLWKYDGQGNLIWDDDYSNPPVAPYGTTHDQVYGLGVDNEGRTVMTVKARVYGTGSVVYSPSGVRIWDDFTPLVDTSSFPDTHVAMDFLGYVATVDIDDDDAFLQRYGDPWDYWENDKSWIWAHPWIHPAGPPQYHNFHGDVDDWISFHARAGQTYRITTAVVGSALPGVQTTLYDGDAQTVLQSTTQNELLWTAPASGRHHVLLNPTDGTFGADRDYSVTIAGDPGPSHVWSSKLGLNTTPKSGNVVAEGPDGTIWVLGRRGSACCEDFTLHRLDEDGQITSSRYYDTGASEEGKALTVGETGNPVVVGATDESSALDDLLLLELDASTGAPVLEMVYDMGGLEEIHDIVRAEDGYWVLGTTDAYGPRGVWLLRLDAAGAVMFSRTIHHNEADIEGFDLEPGHDLVTVAGRWHNDASLMQIGEDGKVLWAKYYRETGATLSLSAVVESADGRLTAVGTRNTTELLVVSTDAKGEPLWSHSYGPGQGRGIVESADGGFVIAGSVAANGNDDGWLLALEATGEVKWERAIGDSNTQSFYGIDRGADGGFVLTGHHEEAAGGFTKQAHWTIKTDPDGGLSAGCSMASSTSATVSDVSVRVITWSPDEETDAPTVFYPPDPIAWADLSDALVTECELHEPGSVGATTLVFDDVDTLSWGEAPNRETFSLYRGVDPGDTESFVCIATEIPDLTTDDTDTPPPGVLWSYVVVGKNGLGEGPMGPDSSGAFRAHPAACSP